MYRIICTPCFSTIFASPTQKTKIMYTGLKHTHYTLMIILVILLLFTAARFFMNSRTGAKFGKFENIQSLLTLITAHLQLVLGLGLYFNGSWASMLSNMGEIMKDSATRLIVIEHPLTMIIGIVLITIGRAKAKRKATDKEKFTTTAIFYGIALVLILVRIPWGQING